MKTAKTEFFSENEITEYVNECENGYLSDVSGALEATKNGGRIITLSGPTCSGKTTTSLILDGEFEKCGKTLHTVSIDDFYIDRDILDKRCREKGIPLDYDSPSTIDFDYFGEVIEAIDKKSSVTLPRFDFTVGKRTGYYDIKITQDDVFMFEGIQAVYPECTSLLASHNYTALFISVGDGIAYDKVTFGPRELRLLRRIVRDYRTRNTSPEKTLALWEGVCKNEDAHIFPNLTEEHIYIDSSLAYEASVIKPFAEPLLKSCPDSETAKRLLKKLENVPSLDAKYVPNGSVFREFIG